MEIIHYISELIQENDCVIVPGFGAFLSRYQPAFFSGDGRTLYPPTRVLTFSSDLKTNDGLLLNHVARGEGTTAPLAFRMIEHFRDDLQYRLDHNEVVTLGDLGNFSRSRGQIVFLPSPELNIDPDGLGLSPVSIDPSETYGGAPGQQIPQKSRRSRLLWWLVPPVAAACVIATWFLYPAIMQKEISGTFTPAITEVQSEQISELPLPDTGETALTADSVQEIDTPPESPADIWYLIGGSFKEKENADKFFTRMERRGLTPRHLGMRGNFYLVAIGAYKSIGRAVTARDSILRLDSAAGVWVMEPE